MGVMPPAPLTKDITALAALFATSGVTHFIKPQHFEGIVPKLLPRKRELVYISGVAELACAAGLLHPGWPAQPCSLRSSRPMCR